LKIFRKYICWCALLLLVLPVAVWATGDQLIAQLRPSGFVNDYAGVFMPQQKQLLERQLQELEQKTGAEVTVVTLDTLDGGEIDDFANRLFAAWGIGKKGKDNGVLLLAAIKDRKGRIEVGYGLEGVIPDGLAGRIMRNEMFPDFKTGNYAAGMTKGAQTVARLIAKDEGVSLNGMPRRGTENYGKKRKKGLFDFIFMIVVVIIVIRNPWLLIFFLGSGSGGGRSGGFGGGFGGFGGGMSGGGGASGGW